MPKVGSKYICAIASWAAWDLLVVSGCFFFLDELKLVVRRPSILNFSMTLSASAFVQSIRVSLALIGVEIF